MRRLGTASWAYIALGSLYSIGDFLMGANHVVYLQESGLSGFGASLVVAVLLGSVALCDLPTGVVADTWGRKRTMVVGFFTLAAGEALFGLAGTSGAAAIVGPLGPFIVSSLLRGLGMALLTGVFIAWYFGAAGPGRDGREVSLALSWGEGLKNVGGVLAGLLAFLLIGVWSGLPMLVAALLHAATGLWAWLFLPENYGDRSGSPVRLATKHLALFWQRRRLGLLAGANLLIDTGFVFLVFLWQPLLVSHGAAERALGIVFPLLMLSLAAGGFSAGWLLGRWEHRAVAVAGVALLTGGLAAQALLVSPAAAAALLMLAEFGLGLTGPSLGYLLNDAMPDSGRATLNSAVSAAGGATGLLAVLGAGFLLDRVGPGPAYLAVSLPLVLAALLVWAAGQRSGAAVQ